MELDISARTTSEMIGARQAEVEAKISHGSLLVQRRTHLSARLASLQSTLDALMQQKQALSTMLQEEQKHANREQTEELRLLTEKQHLALL
eukprot:2228781-Amphidinium_carterae.1